MPAFKYDPNKATAGQLILPKGSYNFQLGKPATFIFNKDPNKISYGVQYPLTVMTDGPFKGKSTTFRCFLHTEGACDMAKRFQVAAAGMSNKQDDDFNAKYGMKDFGYDTDTKIVGDGWKEFQGAMITADCDVKMGENNQENQQFNFRPYGA